MENILLIGTGPMAIAYAETIHSQNIPFSVVGRGEESAKKFEEITGKSPFIGGLESYLESNNISDNTIVIIATGTEVLMQVLLKLINTKVKRILIEKPAALSIAELIQNEKILLEHANNIFVAYNRRFYASVIEAKKLIQDDGGLQSMHFEFTEWAHKIEPLKKAAGVKENWFFANSTHVIDLAFFLAGKPKDWNAYSKSGALSWHSKTNFVGAGKTDQGVLFSYISNWESAGRWSIELLTEQRRIYLKPMEEIFIQKKGSIEINHHEFDNYLDLKYKPGIFRQIMAFWKNDLVNLQTIEAHIENSKNIYNKIIS